MLFLALRRTPLLGDRSVAIIGTSEIRHEAWLEKSGSLINWHALAGSDTTGHIHEMRKTGCFATFKKANPTILIAL